MKRVLIIIGLTLLATPGAQAQSGATRLTLAEALHRADSASEVVGLARAGVVRARADEMRARSGYLPQVSGAATYTRTLASQFSGFAGEPSNDSIPAPTGCVGSCPPRSPARRRLARSSGASTARPMASARLREFPFGGPTPHLHGSGSQALFIRALGSATGANAVRERPISPRPREPRPWCRRRGYFEPRCRRLGNRGVDIFTERAIAIPAWRGKSETLPSSNCYAPAWHATTSGRS